jgi:hypothetical protein
VDDGTTAPERVANRAAAFFVAGIAALLLVGALTWLWGQRTGTGGAVLEAQQDTEALGARIVDADVVTGLLTDDPLAIEEVDGIVDGQTAEVLGVTLFTADGDPIYTRDPLAGVSSVLDETALDALQNRAPATELRISSDPSDTVLRVHQPVERPEGDALLLQVDYDYEVITAAGLAAWRMFAPVTLGALVGMALLWMLLAAIGGRRGRRAEAPRPAPERAHRQPPPAPREIVLPEVHRPERDAWLDEAAPRTQAFTPHLRLATPPTPTPPQKPAPAPARAPEQHPAARHLEPAGALELDGEWLEKVQGGTPFPAVPLTTPVSEDEVELPGAMRDGGPKLHREPAAAATTSIGALRTFTAPPVLDRPANGNGNGYANGNGHSNGNGNGHLNGGHGYAAALALPEAAEPAEVPRRHRSLEEALSQMLAPMARDGIDTRLDLPPGLHLPDETEVLLLRAAEEALRNAVAHADPTTLKVRLNVEDRWIDLTIEDDGTGFEPTELVSRPGERRHRGLRSLTRLAADAGGSLHLRSAPGRGTRFYLRLPAA